MISALPGWTDYHQKQPSSAPFCTGNTISIVRICFLLFAIWIISPYSPLIKSTLESFSSLSSISSSSDRLSFRPSVKLKSSSWTSTKPQSRPFRHHDFNERYLTYLPHSGFQNQLGELQNALAIAKYTNRTLLLPPVWVTRPIHLGSYGWMQRQWEAAIRDNLTFVAWDFVYDLSFLKDLGIRLSNRWGENIFENTLFNSLGINESDVLRIKEDIRLPKVRYDLQFTTEPLSSNNLIEPIPPQQIKRFHRKLSLPVLASLPHRVILCGSLFGFDRVLFQGHELFYTSDLASRFLPRQEKLKNLAREIAKMLGGEGHYFGALARVQDGSFQRDEEKNMKILHRELVTKIYRAYVKKSSNFVEISEEDIQKNIYVIMNKLDMKIGNSWFHPPRIQDHSIKQLDSNLVCQGALHNDPMLKLFNKPLHISTDARSPATHPSFRRFYATFPCLFILSDFVPLLPNIQDIFHWKSEDGADIGSLMIPMLDGMVAAAAEVVQATVGSTFGRFAAGPLHENYAIDGI